VLQQMKKYAAWVQKRRQKAELLLTKVNTLLNRKSELYSTFYYFKGKKNDIGRIGFTQEGLII